MMNAFTLYRSTLVAAAAATLLLVACSRNEDGLTTGQVTVNTDTVADRAEMVLQDATITATVKAELARDTALGAETIAVTTQRGLVEMRGKAPDIASRERATRIALAVNGVLSVENRLTVDGDKSA